MLKKLELDSADSCFNRATDNEWLFVLLGRDIAAPATIRFWVQERIRLGKNVNNDAQIQEALRCANSMEGLEPTAQFSEPSAPEPSEPTADHAEFPLF